MEPEFHRLRNEEEMKVGYSRRDMLKTGLAASAALLAPSYVFAFTGEGSAAEMARIRERFIESVLPKDPKEIQNLMGLGKQYAEKLGPDGSWSDVDYESETRSNWSAAAHLDRTRVMAMAAAFDRKAGHPDQGLDAKVLRALKYWTLHDYQNPNWWWNQIGVPRLAGRDRLLDATAAFARAAFKSRRDHEAQ